MTQLLSAIEIEPTSQARHSMIWLHGLGADGGDFVPLTTQLHPAIRESMRFVFPNAPMMPVTLNNGYPMRAWFDIHAIGLDAPVDMKGVRQSIEDVEKLIQKECERGIAVENIYLGGFSQGASVALLAGLTRQQKPLGGIMALSSYLPPDPELREQLLSASHRPRIFQAHGTLDPVVPYELGVGTYEWLTQTGYTIDWHTYPMAHTVCQEEFDDINAWLTQQLNQ